MKKPLTLSAMIMVASVMASAGPALIPLPGISISGTPGSTIGWGYSLSNDSSTDWYVPLTFSAPAFADGTPFVLFDYPAVAPLDTVTETYNPGTKGLLELAIFPGASIGAQDTGTAILSGNYYSDNPFTNPNAVIVAAAPDTTASISATVTSPSTVPEPATVWLAIGFLCGCVSIRRRAPAR